MGKMTDALRKARMLKDRKEGVSAPAPIEEYVAPEPAAEQPAARVAPAPAAPPPPKIEPRPQAKPVERQPEPPLVEGEDYSLVEEDESASELPEIESLPIIDEPETKREPPRAAPVAPSPVPRRPERPTPTIIEPREPEEKPLVFEAVEKEAPAPPPKPAPAPVIEAPAPVAAKKPEPAPPAPAVARTPEPKPAPVFRMPEEPKKAPEPVAMSWTPEAEPVREEKPDAAAPAPAPVLPEVEATPAPSKLPYLSVHYGRDERLAEQFRALKARLNEEGQARLILVASSRAGEGKTTLAMNLASSFANTYGERVVIVNGNVVRPKVAEVLDVGEEAPGLGRAVRGLVSAGEAAVQTVVSGLRIVRADKPGRGSEGLLDSEGMRALLAELRRHFTRVIVEIPAIEGMGEGLTLAAQADVVLVPVMKSKSRRKSVRRLVDTLKDRGAQRVRCVFIEA